MGVENTAAYKSYAYDTENQLIREDNKEDNKTFVFDYDDLGNISSKTIYNYTSPNVTPTSATSTVTYRYGKNGSNGWNHLLTGVDSDGVDGFGDNETITYDEIGNPEKYLGATLEWYGRQLQSYTKDGVEFTYSYDTDGLRATKDVNDVNYTYHYVGGQLRYETRGDEKFYYFYDASGVISGFRYVNANGTAALYYTLTNAQGDVVALYNQNGGWVGSYEYDAWGNVVKMLDGSANVVDDTDNTQIISKNAIRYRGYYYDEETKFYYLQSRYYNPEVGRFLNADGMLNGNGDVLGFNMFAYCGNNPVNRADPTGQFWGIVVGVTLVVGLVVSLSGCSAKPKPEPYKSADDAAKAFSEQVYSSSSYIRHEYSTEIYSRTINGETTYNYNPPRAGNPHSVSVGNSTPKGTKTVAYAHTHPNSNVFSGADIRAAENLKIDAYVVGPNLELQRYSLSSASTTNLGVISPIALTDAQRSSLVTEFQVSWDAHIADGCDFNCDSMVWPAP